MSTTTRALADAFARAFEAGDAEGLARLSGRRRDDARPDLSRVHPTWIARALREESPAVRGAVAAFGPPRVAEALVGEAGVPEPVRPPHPEALAWALALWSERLVGGSDRDDHPPALAALVRPSNSEGFRLCVELGRAKAALARGGAEPSWIERRLGSPTDAVRRWAMRDVLTAGGQGLPPRRAEAWLGLMTPFRLLTGCDPFDVRGALQRLPYPVVRGLRAATPRLPAQAAGLAKLEALLLRECWRKLHREGRIVAPYPDGREERR